MLKLNSEVDGCLINDCELNPSNFFSILSVVNNINIENLPEICQILLNE